MVWKAELCNAQGLNTQWGKYTALSVGWVVIWGFVLRSWNALPDLMSLLSLNTEQYSNYARTLNPNFAFHSCAGAQPTFIVNRIQTQQSLPRYGPRHGHRPELAFVELKNAPNKFPIAISYTWTTAGLSLHENSITRTRTAYGGLETAAGSSVDVK